MTQRRLLIGYAAAIAVAFAGIQRSTSAQNNEKKEPPAASSDSSANNSQNNNQSNSQKDQNNGSSSQNDKDKSSDSNTSSSNQGTTSNNSQSNSSQSSDKQSNANNNTQAPRDTKSDQNRSADRSTSDNDKRDGQADRKNSDSNRSNADRGSDNRNADNRNADSRRDFRNDFKFGRSTDRGLAIATLVTDSIFYRSGLRNGDVIVSYNGHRLRSQDDFGRYVVYEPGQRVPVVVYRNGREETIYVVYENKDTAGTPAGGSPLFGADFDPQSSDGAVIIRVQKGGPADKAGLQENDLVVALNGEKVQDGRQAIEWVNRMQSGDRAEVEYMRHAKAQVTLGGGGAVSDTRFYRGDKDSKETSVAVGVDTDQTRRDNSARDRDNDDRNRRDDSKERSRLLPRLRN